MNYQNQLNLQIDFNKIAICLQFYLIFIWKKTLAHWKKSCQGMGVPIEENKCLFSLNYADGQVIIAEDAHDLELINQYILTWHSELE